MADYAHPDVLVSTGWVAEHLDDDTIRVVESDEDITLYDTGHVPGAVMVDWQSELQDAVVRDYVSPARFEELMRGKGIANDHTLVFYGDNNNWWACYAFWAFRMFGHEKLKIMDGGRKKWIAEERPLTRERPDYPRTEYRAQVPDLSNRAFAEQVLPHVRAGRPLVDVRSPGEYTGELLHMPDYPQEGALRGGHIPGAHNVPWSTAVAEDGTFRSPEELEEIYVRGKGLARDDDVVAYCRIGERSAHTWFVLKYLLGFEKVRNYDGSWTEWGNRVGVPIVRGPEPGDASEGS